MYSYDGVRVTRDARRARRDTGWGGARRETERARSATGPDSTRGAAPETSHNTDNTNN